MPSSSSRLALPLLVMFALALPQRISAFTTLSSLQKNVKPNTFRSFRRYHQNVRCYKRTIDKTTTATTALFASCPPPRFDSFSEQIVGKWNNEIDTTENSSGEVEEVMRSCGGAVQGVREIPFAFDTTNEEGKYHNRADDGFIYFDCGSYTSGPVKFDIENSDNGAFYGSLSFSYSTPPKKRMLIVAEIGSSQESDKKLDALHSSYVTLARQRFGATASAADETEEESELSISDVVNEMPSNIVWEKETLCRMPTLNQPWMLQRVKWEKFISEVSSDEEEKDGENDSDGSENHLTGWCNVWTARDASGNDDIKQSPLWSSDSLNFFLNEGAASDGQQNGFVIQMGAYCTQTNQAKALLRSYNSNGILQGVCFQEGKKFE